MDVDRLAVLLHTIARFHSRRGVLRGLSVLGLAGIFYREEGVARKKRKKKRKKRLAAPPPLSPSPPPGPPPGPPPPPPATCPPVCPICQGCNPTTGVCEGHPSQQSLPAPGCNAPQVCCGGSCCEQIHACNDAGTCQTCPGACPADDCVYCVHLIDGSTECASFFGVRCDLPESCSTDSDCFDFRPRCVAGYTDKATNVTAQVCGGQPEGRGRCGLIIGCGA